MGLNAVLQHVKSVINDLPIPGQQNPLDAKVIPPPVEPLKGTKGWITTGRMQGARQTSPRGPGFAQSRWPVDITLDLLVLGTDESLEQAFYLAVDAVLAALWGTEMPVFITDPTTGIQTQLLAIGEDFGFEPGNWVTTANSRMILLRGRISTDLKEAFQTGAYASGGTVIP